MYHLSKELSGVVLPADTFGSHLKDGRTIDEVMEERNFEAAGGVLAEIWSQLVIDDHPVRSEYEAIRPTDDITQFSVTPSYKSRHLIQTQYMTVALKCEDKSCCLPPKTMIGKFFPDRRVPTLIPLKQTSFGPQALPVTQDVVKEELSFLDVFQRLAMESFLLPEDLKMKFNNKVPYDVYFPSLQKKVDQRICKSCGKYFSLKLSMIEHRQVCKKKRTQNHDEGPAKKRSHSCPTLISAREAVQDEFYEDEEEEENLEGSFEDDLEVTALRPVISVPAPGGVETIMNLKEWLKSPYQLISEL